MCSVTLILHFSGVKNLQEDLKTLTVKLKSMQAKIDKVFFISVVMVWYNIGIL